MASTRRRVAARIAKLRHARGLSQEVLAKQSRLARMTLTRLERGVHQPNLATLERIARALRVSLVDLVR